VGAMPPISAVAEGTYVRTMLCCVVLCCVMLYCVVFYSILLYRIVQTLLNSTFNHNV
jgi:hypothetical protein